MEEYVELDELRHNHPLKDVLWTSREDRAVGQSASHKEKRVGQGALGALDVWTLVLAAPHARPSETGVALHALTSLRPPASSCSGLSRSLRRSDRRWPLGLAGRGGPQGLNRTIRELSARIGKARSDPLFGADLQIHVAPRDQHSSSRTASPAVIIPAATGLGPKGPPRAVAVLGSCPSTPLAEMPRPSRRR